MDEYSKTLYEEEYTNDEDWMNAAVHSGIIDQESKEGLLWHIHQVIKRGHWYKPSDMRIEEDGTIRIPRTLQSLHGYMAQWDHDKELIKAGGEWYKRGNFSRDEIPEEMRNKEIAVEAETLPPSLNFDIKDERLEKLIMELDKQALYKENINMDSFRYAITGEGGDTPFEPITVLKRTKGIIYQTLLELQQEEDQDSKVLTNERKKNAGDLFKYDDGKLIGPLSNPKY